MVKTGECDDVTFWNAILVFFILVRENKSHFWNYDAKLDKTGIFLQENLNF